MGDVAISVPVLKAFTRLYPNIKLTILTRSFFNPFFKNIPNITVVNPDLKGRHRGFLGIRTLAKELQVLQITQTADLHYVLRSIILARMLKLKNIPYQQIDKGRNDKKALTRAKNKIFKPLKTSLQRYIDVFYKMGFPIQITSSDVLGKLPLPKNILKSSKKHIGIAPFAAHTGKMYPIQKMEDVIHQLCKNTNYTVFLFGGGTKEKEVLDAIAAKYNNVINTVNTFSFEEELALISNLNLMLAMDSSNGHLAAMFGVPTLTVWGVTHPYAGFTPFMQPEKHQITPNLSDFPLLPTSIYGNKYPDGYLECFNTILPKLILTKIENILK